jgi:hypothetical protein
MHVIVAQTKQESQSQKFIEMELKLTLEWKKTLETNIEWTLCGD